MNELFFFVKHPYAAGIIAVIWLASTSMYALDRDLDIVFMVLINMAVSFVIAMVGFRGGKKG
jgi:hypothetical protein